MRKKRLLAILATGERSRGELADPAQEDQVAVAALQTSAQGEVCPGMNTTYTVKHIQKGPTLFIMVKGYQDVEPATHVLYSDTRSNLAENEQRLFKDAGVVRHHLFEDYDKLGINGRGAKL